MRIRVGSIAVACFWLFSVSGSGRAAEPPPVIGGAVARPKPQVPLKKARVVIEWQNILDDCSTEKICVQGGLYSDGPQIAYNVQLRVEIGSANLSKPRLVKSFKVETPEMNTGDRQDFYFELERKMPYKDHKGKAKVLEVGKFNFKVIPIWTDTRTKSGAAKTRGNLTTVKKKKTHN